MASVYSKRGILYISWYDWSLSKTRNRSTRLQDTPANRKLVKKISDTLQAELGDKKEEYDKHCLVRGGSLKKAFEHFLRNNSNKSKKTIEEYNMFFKLFKKTFNEDEPATVLNKLDIEAWLIELRNIPHYAQNTKHTYYKQCVHFLNFLFEYSYIPMFMINKSIKIGQENKEIITFTDEQIEKIFANLKGKRSNFKTLIWMAYYTGLRPSSLITIKAESIDLKNKVYQYWDAKRKKWVENPFHDDLLPILAKRVEEVKTGPIIKYQDASAVSATFREYLREMNIYKRGINTKTFRKTFISKASSTMELSTVSKLVGHENITTTSKYYNKVDLERKRNELHKLDVAKGVK